MNTEIKQQKSQVMKTTGSLFNWLMGNNQTLPVVGKGATILSWTDRHAYEVMEVSEDGKRVIVQEYEPERTDNYGMSDTQQYKYEKLIGRNVTIVWKWGAWRIETEKVMFTEEYGKTIGQKFWESEDYKLLYPNNSLELALVEGKSELKKSYQKINIIWGVLDEHYDYSF